MSLQLVTCGFQEFLDFRFLRFDMAYFKLVVCKFSRLVKMENVQGHEQGPNLGPSGFGNLSKSMEYHRMDTHQPASLARRPQGFDMF